MIPLISNNIIRMASIGLISICASYISNGYHVECTSVGVVTKMKPPIDVVGDVNGKLAFLIVS